MQTAAPACNCRHTVALWLMLSSALSTRLWTEIDTNTHIQHLFTGAAVIRNACAWESAFLSFPHNHSKHLEPKPPHEGDQNPAGVVWELLCVSALSLKVLLCSVRVN